MESSVGFFRRGSTVAGWPVSVLQEELQLGTEK